MWPGRPVKPEIRRLGRPGSYQRLTFGQPWVNLGSTFGQPSVFSLAISARFSLILPDSQMKNRDRRYFFHEIVDFPIGKQHFWVCWWSGAFSEPLERKKRQNQMFLQDLHSFAPLQIQICSLSNLQF